MVQDISKKFTAGQLLKFAFPSMVMMIFVSLYTIVDGFFVAHYVGDIGLTAVNISYPLISLFVAIGIMFATGGSAVIAMQLGQGKNKLANRNFTLIVVFVLALSVIGLALSLFYIDPILRFLGADDTVIALCIDYTEVLLMFSPMFVLQLLFQTFFVTAGKPMLGLSLTIISGLFNVVLDYLLIGVFEMGVAGAALATASSYCVPAIGGLIFFATNKKGLHFVKPKWNAKLLIQSCFNGSSEMVTNLSASLITVLFNVIMMFYLGTSGVAAITVILYCQFLMTSMFLGFSIGVAPIISYNFGANDTVYLKKLKKICWCTIFAMSGIIFIISICASSTIAAIFSDVGSQTYYLIKDGLSIFSVAFLFAGINIFASAMFTALSDGKTSAIISFLRTFVFIIFGIYLMMTLFALDGLWMAVPFAETLTLVVTGYFVIRHNKKSV